MLRTLYESQRPRDNQYFNERLDTWRILQEAPNATWVSNDTFKRVRFHIKYSNAVQTFTTLPINCSLFFLPKYSKAFEVTMAVDVLGFIPQKMHGNADKVTASGFLRIISTYSLKNTQA